LPIVKLFIYFYENLNIEVIIVSKAFLGNNY